MSEWEGERDNVIINAAAASLFFVINDNSDTIVVGIITIFTVCSSSFEARGTSRRYTALAKDTIREPGNVSPLASYAKFWYSFWMQLFLLKQVI